jgi:signal transduction histidine kinase
MAHVFSFRFLDRITGAGAQVLRSFGRIPASADGRAGGSDPAPGAKDPTGIGVFRAATEKLATNTAVTTSLETAEPRDPLPEPEPAVTSAHVVAMPTAEAEARQDREPTPEALEPARSAGRKALSTDEHAAFEAIAALLGSRTDGRAEVRSTGERTAATTEPAETRARDAGLAAPKATSDNPAILDLLPLGIIVFRDRDPIFVNRFLLDLLGVGNLRAALALGRFEGIARLLSGSTLGAEIIDVDGVGGAIAMIASVHAIPWDGATASLACLRACTESGWKRIEEDLRDAQRQAERASALKSDFLAKVSHEIRTPLNAILGFAEVILDERFGPIGNARYKEYLKDIHASGAHVMSLVNDLLDLSKIEAGKLDLAFAPVDANVVVAECVSIMQPQAIRERVVLRLSLWPDLPPVLADERSLRQIVLNLLSNAVKFNEPGGQVVVATVLAASGQALLRVKDTGIGMSDPEIEIALEPFGRVVGTRPSVGTGLGLPLTKALVEANRAQFSITSKKSEGTLVEIAFPSA